MNTKYALIVRVLMWALPPIKRAMHNARLEKLEALAKDIMPTVPPMLKINPETGEQVSDDEGRIKRAFELARCWMLEVHE